MPPHLRNEALPRTPDSGGANLSNLLKRKWKHNRRNAKDISGAVASFYGDAAGAGMLELLSGHWGAVKAMTDAAKKGDEAGVQKGMDDGIANAAEIAKFHGGRHRRGSRDLGGNATHMDVISDALADAIAKQLPDKAS